MRLLIVNYHHSPAAGAHGYRWLQLAHHIGQAYPDAVVEVICGGAAMPSNPSRDGRVVRVGVRRSYQAEGGATAAVEAGSVNAKARKQFGKRLRTMYRSLFWPDGLWHWLPFALFALYRQRARDYDYVVSYSPTFSAHVAVLLARKSFGLKGRWIADYGDPFSLSESMPPNNFRVWRGVNRRVERAILGNADAVVFTNDATRQVYADAFGEGYPLRVIPHLVDLSLFNVPARKSADAQRLALTYVGGFHRGIREPGPAVELIETLRPLLARENIDLHLDMYGPANGCELADLPAAIAWHGRVSRDTAIELLRTANVLVNIENRNCVMAPSKIVEYIATGLPIVNVAFSPTPSVPALCRYIEAGHGIHVTPDYDPAQVIERLLHLAMAPRLSAEEVRPFLVEHVVDQVARHYFGPPHGVVQ